MLQPVFAGHDLTHHLAAAGTRQPVPGIRAALLRAGELAAAELAGLARTKVGEDLGLLQEDIFRFCWIVDFPMYEFDEREKRVDFSHNPFSMPQGGRAALAGDPLSVLATQYDLVCNGVELSSGAIRNHEPDTLIEAFALAGHAPQEVERRFGGLPVVA